MDLEDIILGEIKQRMTNTVCSNLNVEYKKDELKQQSGISGNEEILVKGYKL